ncbi:MAG: hypothetical protein LBJ02_12450 [Bifidobacteriaceae bacterium]|nr:hypothetical protein [Bifidobacteriaceae bacterium]
MVNEDLEFESMLLEAIGQYVEDTTPDPILSREDMYVGAMAGFEPHQAAAILINATSLRKLEALWAEFRQSRNSHRLPSDIEEIITEEALLEAPRWHTALANATGFGAQVFEPGYSETLQTLPRAVLAELPPTVRSGGAVAFAEQPALAQPLFALAAGAQSLPPTWDPSQWKRTWRHGTFRVGARLHHDQVVLGVYSGLRTAALDVALTWDNGTTTLVRVKAVEGQTEQHPQTIPTPGGTLPLGVLIKLSA